MFFSSLRRMRRVLFLLAVAFTASVHTGFAQSGTVTGKATDAVTGAPLAGLEFLSSCVGNTFPLVLTAADGTFTSGPLFPGSCSVFLEATELSPLASQGYIIQSKTATVVANATTTVNFQLIRGAQFSGHVQDAVTLAPVAGVSVTFTSPGLGGDSGTTDAAGNYMTPNGVPAGVYYARTSGSAYLGQLYDNLPCAPTCAPATGAPITAITASVTPGINFSLTKGGQIAGTITDATSAPLFAVGVTVFDVSGTRFANGVTNTAGTYTTSGMPAGSYFVVTSDSWNATVSQVYPGQQCLGCTPAAIGTPVSVTLATITPNIDFTLARGGRVSGTVASTDGGGLGGLAVEVYGTSATPAVTARTGIGGGYQTGIGLPTGTYTVRTQNSNGFVNAVYDGRACVTSCNPATGDPVSVVAPDITTGINFTLAPDTDLDLDGIAGSIDTLPSVYSNDFSDVLQGGTTSGTIASRGGWTAGVGDVSPGGVKLNTSGAGTSAAIFQTCPTGGVEEVWLDDDGATATAVCDATTGSTTVRATATTTVIQLRKTVGTLTTELDLTPQQSATIGSPASADAGNRDPVHVRLLNFGIEIGSFDLDPGESAEAAEANGVVSVHVFAGTVAVTVNGETATLTAGQTHGFDVCTPISFDGLTAAPSVLWPPNHQMETVTVSPATGGTCGAATCRIVSVASSEPVNGLGDGDTAPDWAIGPGLTLQLRAERAGRGSGRAYTITIECTDQAGDRATRTVVVTVPHNR